jgi:hypothetical protein
MFSIGRTTAPVKPGVRGVSFAARHGIARAFAYDADSAAAGLAPVTPGS